MYVTTLCEMGTGSWLVAFKVDRSSLNEDGSTFPPLEIEDLKRVFDEALGPRNMLD